MNKHFNINYAEQESDWKDLTIVKLLSEISDLEDKIDKAIEYIDNDFNRFNCFGHLNVAMEMTYKKEELLDILKGSDEE